MKVTVLQEHLMKALTRTGRIVSPKSPLPIAQHVLVEAKEGRLKLAVTNLETTEVVGVGAKVTAEGGICVPSRLLSELVATLPADSVELVVKEGVLAVSCGKFRATLPGMETREFPPIPAVAGASTITLEKSVILGALAQVLFSAATDEGRPLLTGIRFTTRGDETLVAATDGYRLSVKHLPLAPDGGLDLVVPARALAEVVKVSGEEKDVAEVVLLRSSDNQLAFVVGDTEIFTRLIDGEYPNFEKIIPATHLTELRVDREQLSRAVKSVAIFARDSANIIKLHVEGQTIVVSANTPQVGENTVEVEATVSGDGGDIAFNSRFLTEFLSTMTAEEIVFRMGGSLNPGVFMIGGDETFLHIIMPVRVSA